VQNTAAFVVELGRISRQQPEPFLKPAIKLLQLDAQAAAMSDNNLLNRREAT
jgi:hypothetical protein